MFVQGLGLLSMNIKQQKSYRSEKTASSKEHSAVQHANTRSTNTTDRTELLQKIKDKIQSGFYNSDAVLEDLSHGFAKVLDENV
jgi:anti-sigma28 factor (negative regulator of flagellin synthesis)